MEILALSIKMIWVFSFIFGVYEFGERLSGSFEELNDEYDQFAWHLFPMKAQRMLTVLLRMAQKPIELRVFGSTPCGRITLKNVGRKRFSSPIRNQFVYEKFLYIHQ